MSGVRNFERRLKASSENSGTVKEFISAVFSEFSEEEILQLTLMQLAVVGDEIEKRVRRKNVLGNETFQACGRMLP